MTSSLFGKPAPGFDQPLGALVACHDRITKQLAILSKLPDHLAAQGADEEARRAATGIVRYFDTSAPHHHADEEVDLFPRMAVHAIGENVRRVAVLTAKLREEHVAMAQAWQRLRPALMAIAAGQVETVDAANFIARYQSHMAKEEAELLPLAAKLLTTEDLTDLGEAMAARRGLASPGA